MRDTARLIDTCSHGKFDTHYIEDERATMCAGGIPVPPSSVILIRRDAEGNWPVWALEEVVQGIMSGRYASDDAYTTAGEILDALDQFPAPEEV